MVDRRVKGVGLRFRDQGAAIFFVGREKLLASAMLIGHESQTPQSLNSHVQALLNSHPKCFRFCCGRFRLSWPETLNPKTRGPNNY